MRLRVRSPFGLCCAAAGLWLAACSGDAPEPEPATPPKPLVEPKPAADDGGDPTAGTDDDAEVVVDDDERPTEPEVTLVEPGDGGPATLPARTAGEPRRMVVAVALTEGRKRALHVPRVALSGDLQLLSIDDEGSRYAWTPVATTISAPGDGVDPEFLAGFRDALAVADAPKKATIATDRWDVVSSIDGGPTTEHEHGARVLDAQRFALGHLALPLPSLSLSGSATWKVARRIDVLGIASWQVITAQANKIDGDQLEVTGTVAYFSIDDVPVDAPPMGLPAVITMQGVGKLRARYDLRAAMPVEMQVRGKLDVVTEPGKKAKRIGFSVRVDEDFVANLDPRVKLSGQFVQGGLIHGVVPPDTKVRFNNRKVMVSPEGDFLFGFGRDSGPRARLSLTFAGEPPQRHIVHVQDREFEPEAIDGLPPEMVDLDKQTRRALGKSKVRIKRLRNKQSKVAFYRDGFRWPMKGKLTSTYGRKRILNGEDRGFHWGVDLAAPVGTKVRAPAPGVVVLAEADVPLSGTLLILDHGHGLSSSFLHLDKLKVKVGDEVKAGQVIATSGNTGRSTGPHLDWRMNLLDTRVDPMTLVPPR